MANTAFNGYMNSTRETLQLRDYLIRLTTSFVKWSLRMKLDRFLQKLVKSVDYRSDESSPNIKNITVITAMITATLPPMYRIIPPNHAWAMILPCWPSAPDSSDASTIYGRIMIGFINEAIKSSTHTGREDPPGEGKWTKELGLRSS